MADVNRLTATDLGRENQAGAFAGKLLGIGPGFHQVAIHEQRECSRPLIDVDAEMDFPGMHEFADIHMSQLGGIILPDPLQLRDVSQQAEPVAARAAVAVTLDGVGTTHIEADLHGRDLLPREVKLDGSAIRQSDVAADGADLGGGQDAPAELP